MKPGLRFWIGFKGLLAEAIFIAWLLSPSQGIVVTDHQLITGDRACHYRLVVPDHASTKPAPVVLAFHGTGDTAASMAEYSQLDDLAARHQFILVYPEADDSGWTINATDGDPSALPDIQFVDQLLTTLADRLPLDRSRIYSVGMSSGATFAQRVAMIRPDVAAVVAHSGPAPAGQLTGRNRFPILFLIGESDRLDAAVRDSAAAYAQRGHQTVRKTIPAHGHEWDPTRNEVMWQFLTDCRLNQRQP